MTEETKVQFRSEGEPAFKPDTGNDNPASSPEVKDPKETTTDTTHSPDGGGNNQDDPHKDTPFHEHPRWKEREDEWTKRFNDQESRHQDELQKIREEFGLARKNNAENTDIPSWFGGTQEQWDEYRKWEDERLEKAQTQAIEKIKSEKTAEEKAIKEATDFMNSEISFIESDKTINPEGLKVDPNKLLKFVLENHEKYNLIDHQNRWNYRSAWLIMRSLTPKTETKPNTEERKKIAGALDSDSKPEKKPAPYKTNEDFRRNKPW